MQYLIPQVIASDAVDRYDIWVNTNDKQDIAFFQRCAEHFPKINLVYQPDGVVTGIRSINAFYKQCLDEDTIYIKLDDDVVWLEPDFFEKMVRFRIDNPDYFLVSPLVINNAVCTYILQVENKLHLKKYAKSSASHRVLWHSGKFAFELHDWFIPKLKSGTYKDLYCGAKPVGLTRFSINSISWFGREFAKWNGEVPGDDEEYLSVMKPTLEGKSCCFNADCLISHFAFYPQREFLDKKDILGRYGKMLREMWSANEKMRGINELILEAMSYVEVHKEEIMAREHIYEILPKPPKRRISKLIKKIKLMQKPWIEVEGTYKIKK